MHYSTNNILCKEILQECGLFTYTYLGMQGW